MKCFVTPTTYSWSAGAVQYMSCGFPQAAAQPAEGEEVEENLVFVFLALDEFIPTSPRMILAKPKHTVK